MNHIIGHYGCETRNYTVSIVVLIVGHDNLTLLMLLLTLFFSFTRFILFFSGLLFPLLDCLLLVVLLG